MDIIRSVVTQALRELELSPVVFSVEHPRDESHGDYSCNVAMVLAKQVGQTPRELAQMIVEVLQKDIQINKLIQKIEVAGPGFINFYLTTDYLLDEAKKAILPGYGMNDSLAGQKTMIEFTDPNPFKEFHIGHLMSNAIGESLARLFEANGAEVMRVNYQGDVGLHVAKSVWGMFDKIRNEKSEIRNWIAEWQNRPLVERQQFMGKAYAMGAQKYETDETVKSEITQLNKQIYDQSDTTINELYQAGRTWSLEYFEVIYKRLGTKFDEYFFESEAGSVGLQVIEEGLTKGVLTEGEGGAVVYRGEQDGLHTRVFRNALGLPTYEGKELGLAKTKYERYPYDRSYIVTANEIDEYFKVLITVMKKLYPELGNKTTHLSHGVMKLTTGKMSSRTGKVVTGEELLNELRDVVLAKMGDRDVKEKERVADQIAVGALKYTVLKQALGGDIVYDPEKMTNLEGDTGPYLQYTFARTQSILRKSENRNQKNEIKQKSKTSNFEFSVSNLQTEELSILRWLYRYGEVVYAAGHEYSPHYVASYLHELSARFNTMYGKHQIVGNELRVQITQAAAQVLLSGLSLLGIVAPKEM